MGEGNKILPITIDEDGIYYAKTTFWKEINPFVANLFLKFIEGVCLILSDEMLSFCRYAVRSFLNLDNQNLDVSSS